MFKYVLFSILISISLAREIDFSNLQSLNAIPTIPGGLLTASEHQEAFDNLTSIVKDKCHKETGSDEAYGEIEKAAGTLKDCLTTIYDVEGIQKEFEEAQTKNNFGELFTKYCKTRPDLIKCFQSFADVTKKCLAEKEKESVDINIRIVDGLLDFVCEKGPGLVDEFVEKAPQVTQCFEDVQESIVACKDKVDIDDDKVEWVIGEEECKEWDEATTCLTASLDKCDEKFPLDVAKSVFGIIEKELDCKKH